MQLGLPKEIVYRQPFPVQDSPFASSRRYARAIVDLTRADDDRAERNEASDWYYRVWQSFAVLLPVRSVGVMAINALTKTRLCFGSSRARTA